MIEVYNIEEIPSEYKDLPIIFGDIVRNVICMVNKENGIIVKGLLKQNSNILLHETVDTFIDEVDFISFKQS